MLKRKPHHKQLQRGIKWNKSGRRNALPAMKRQWNREWKRDFAHIQHCESCGRTPDGSPDSILTQMHAEKQRFITTREGCRRAAWVCWGEHRPYDEATGDDPHGRMRAFVDGLIQKR